MEQARPRVLVVAFSARYALEQLIDDFALSLTRGSDCKAMVPTNYKGSLPGSMLYRIDCGVSKIGGLLASFNPISHLQVLLAFFRFRPDVVHILSGEGFPWTITLTLALFLTRTPYIVTIHDPDPHPEVLVERVNAVIRGPVLRHAAALHIYSEQYRKRVSELNPEGRIEVIPLASYASRFLAYRNEAIQRERLVLLFGRFQPYKAIDVLCRAMQRLPADIRLALAGPGKLNDTEQALVDALGPRVEVHNAYITDAEVAHLMQRAGVVALPYRQVTQSSIPAIAHAFGAPIVASALGRFVEEIPGLNGRLVPPEDPDALAAALASALEGSTSATATQPPPTFDELAPEFLAVYASTFAQRVTVDATA